MASKQVEIDDRNLELADELANLFPPGITTRQGRVNYALSLGLDALKNVQDASRLQNSRQSDPNYVY